MTQLTMPRGATAPTSSGVTLAGLLDGEHPEPEQLTRFHGFGGLHGGVVAALLLGRMEQEVDPDHLPLEVTIHFGSPTRALPDVETAVLRAGRHSSLARADASVQGAPVATATAMFARPRTGRLDPAFAPDPPRGITPLADARPIAIPPEFVPITSVMEIRAATADLPYSGGRRPELCGWVRLTEDVPSPFQRLLILADALAPSYATVLRAPVPVPTARLTVKFAPRAAATDSGWVVVEARTTEAAADGWMSESIDIWDAAGRHLASASQLRTIASSPASIPADTDGHRHELDADHQKETS